MNKQEFDNEVLRILKDIPLCFHKAFVILAKYYASSAYSSEDYDENVVRKQAILFLEDELVYHLKKPIEDYGIDRYNDGMEDGVLSVAHNL